MATVEWENKLAGLSKAEMLHLLQSCFAEVDIKQNLQETLYQQRKLKLKCYECLILERKLFA